MLTKNTWKKLPFSGLPDRCFHTSTLFKHYIITYGGYLLKGGEYPEQIVEIFNTEKGELENNFSIIGEVSEKIQRHSACLVDSNRILIFGGYRGGDVLNDVTIITIEEKSPLLTLTFEKMKTTGGENYFTCSHTANIYQNKMYVFGGRIQNKPLENTNELWRLDLESFRWERCDTVGLKPKARTSHYSAISGDELYILGGYHDSIKNNAKDCHILSLSTFRIWKNLDIKDLHYLFRFSPSTALVGDQLFIIGGSRTLVDEESPAISFNFKNHTIQNITTEGDYSYSRFATAVASKSHIINWGGSELGDSFFPLSSLPLDHVYQGEEACLSVASLLGSEEFSDIKFSVEGSIIPAHKLVLGLKCKYFKNMFSSGMKESQVNVLEIPDVKIEIFQAFLKFLYQNKIEFTETLAIDLYVLADKYIQKELTDICKDFLASRLRLDNFVEIQNFAEMYDVELVKNAVSKFIKENKLQKPVDPDLGDLFSINDETSQVPLENDSI